MGGLKRLEEKVRSGTAKGGITVFLSLILTCVCALTGGLFESARTAGSGWYMQMALNSSLDSLMSLYHRDAFEAYRLFLLEFEDKEGLEKEMEPYCRAYLDAAAFYPLREDKLSVCGLTRITDEQGIHFEKEVLDFMKFGVWAQETDSGALEEWSKAMREAEQLGEITELYQENGRKILALEEAVDRIGDCLKRQKGYLKDADKALDQCRGGRFLSIASRLEAELNRIPGLVEAYEREADRLKEELAASEETLKEKQGDLGAEALSLTEQEMASYRSYTDTEGERRRAVAAARTRAAQNKEILAEAVSKAREVQDYIDSWDSDDDDEPDEEALWSQVSVILNRIRVDDGFESGRVRDKKKMRVLETVSRMAGKDLLSVCVPEGTKVSGAALDMRDLPSALVSVGAGSYEMSGIVLQDVLGSALFTEYASRFFSSFRTEKEGKTQYEKEYFLNGARSERDNLKAAVNRLVVVREALNLLHLFRDSSKRAEARTLALAITGAAGIAPLTEVVTFFILTVWAFAESVEDVKILMNGGKLSVMKTQEEWKVSLSGLAESGKRIWDKTPGSGDGRGLDYDGWLKLFFLIQDRVQLRYRMMDVIQNRIREKQSGFRMEQCAFRVEAEWYGKGAWIPVKRTAGREY
ncbi:hypothetical protein D3Z50_16375 [Clostridiaceae bacterium]|nr:hypothetical protein [Clostridiaceae bacterium]